MVRSISKTNNFIEGLIGDDKSSHDISISRTKRNIRRICLSNNFEYFATWTIDSSLADRYSLSAIVDKMKELCKAFQRIHKDFKYIYVIEKHKDGAFHFHGLVKGVPMYYMSRGRKIDVLKQFKIGDTMSSKIAKQVSEGAEIFHIPFFDNKLGYNTFTKIKSYNRCCNYIIKYISKDSVETLEGQRYFCSRGLSKGESYEVNYIPYELFESTQAYHLEELCSIRDLYFDTITQADLLSFSKIQDTESIIHFIKKYIDKKKSL